MKKITKNLTETAELAKELLLLLVKKNKKRTSAIVLGFCGDLGTGKTTLTQEIAKILGIKEKVISPTFVIMKSYQLKAGSCKLFIHIDAYRLENEKELLKLGWKELINNPENLIIVEWADKIKKILSKDTVYVCLEHINENSRVLDISL